MALNLTKITAMTAHLFC